MMRIFDVVASPPKTDSTNVLAIGKYDGVHIGHQAILRTAIEQLRGNQLAVMTFYPHPSWALSHKTGYDRWLTPPNEQARRLADYGVQSLYRVRFTPEYAETSAEDFVSNHLSALNLHRVVVGYDFRFGQGGCANVEDLERLCAAIEVPVTIVDAIEEHGVKVSSTHIRHCLANGKVEAAEVFLGRPYIIEGVVVHGDAVGRQLGFPTANLADIDEFVQPATGVYAVAVEVCQINGTPLGHWFGVLNAGFRPTLNGQLFRMEVHLLNFNRDIYGFRLRVSFLRKIREEMKFDGLNALKTQINQDAQYVRDMLGLQQR